HTVKITRVRWLGFQEADIDVSSEINFTAGTKLRTRLTITATRIYLILWISNAKTSCFSGGSRRSSRHNVVRALTIHPSLPPQNAYAYSRNDSTAMATMRIPRLFQPTES
ncbi:16440_t:CDS:2, partial [Acaulospora morrowiae]